MSDIAIKVENLGKCYQIGHAKSGELRESFGQWFKKLKGSNGKAAETAYEFWALQNISFEVREGQAVGIIGHNGAGKSTLLKILSRITEPTKGRFEIRGRVSSLLEVGTGFHPELSGRENIYLNGTILGMKRSEIRAKFDEIVAFSGVEKFIDTPVKHYSSGMKVRLAFAVAAHLEPEILIIDEVLAVGDAEFQKKCLGKMDEVSKNEGRTILFVSHNMLALQSLCSEAILLSSGEVTATGSVDQVVSTYLRAFNASEKIKIVYPSSECPGNQSVKLLSQEVVPNEHDHLIVNDRPLEMTFRFENLQKGESVLDVTFHLADEMGNLVFVGSSAFSGNNMVGNGLHCYSCQIPAYLLHEGFYLISRLLIVKDKGTILYEHRDNITFQVKEPTVAEFGWKGAKEGIVRPKLEWVIK
ncbi:polysaccharide ABC transporter ATP-binding protein [Cesiribacter sp. SM1]|uniref:ABC transporter ATP-binding protein n=1 Tax=Cesiribacter sp. SM1 TaxID=2861196 RepID=UPI001CD7AC2E|nr:polysaccharide ABC transporter ATP-binding protein [Cesiribacter sp. SM1]